MTENIVMTDAMVKNQEIKFWRFSLKSACDGYRRDFLQNGVPLEVNYDFEGDAVLARVVNLKTPELVKDFQDRQEFIIHELDQEAHENRAGSRRFIRAAVAGSVLATAFALATAFCAFATQAEHTSLEDKRITEALVRKACKDYIGSELYYKMYDAKQKGIGTLDIAPLAQEYEQCEANDRRQREAVDHIKDSRNTLGLAALFSGLMAVNMVCWPIGIRARGRKAKTVADLGRESLTLVERQHPAPTQ